MPAERLLTYDFQDHAVRVVTIQGEPWFVAADVCRVLEIGNSRDAISRLDEDERDDVGITDAIGREQRTNVVSESGLYALIFTSRKPEAKAFRKWVTSVVLPALRRTGTFTVDDAPHPEVETEDLADMPLREAAHWLSMVREARLLRGRTAALALWDRSPLPKMPPTQAQVADDEQDFGDISAFLTDCVEVTGRPEDRVTASEMAAAFARWAEATGAPGMSPLLFGRRLAQAVTRWRCPTTGRRIGRHKRSVITYTGIILTVGA